MAKDKLKSLTELLSKTLVEIVIDKDTFSILVSTHDWLLEDPLEIAVDSARIYVAGRSEGIRSLNHFSAILRENDRCRLEFGDPQWTNHTELEGEKPKRVAFGGENLPYGVLSRDGQALSSCSVGMDPVTRVYQIIEETGKDPVVFLKSELNGRACAVSGKGSHVMVDNADWLEAHDIGKDTGKLVWRVDSRLGAVCALNEDGSEAALFSNGELRIMKMGKAVEGTVDQSAIATVKVPKPPLWIKLVHSDENELHACHRDGNVSLFDRSTRKFIPIEAPQEGQDIIDSAISPNADCFATIEHVCKEESKRSVYRTIVERKLGRADLSVFGCEIGKEAVEQPLADLNQDR